VPTGELDRAAVDPDQQELYLLPTLKRDRAAGAVQIDLNVLHVLTLQTTARERKENGQ
jgi:hypothetical protein